MTRSKGFSLIEIVVSIGIIGATLVALGALIHTVPLVRMTHNQDLARAIASGELESLRAGGYGALPASGSFSAALMSSLPSGAGSLTVSVYNAQTKQVVVTVSWQDPGEATRSVSLTTLMAETGGLP